MKLDRDYLDYIKKEINRHSEESTEKDKSLPLGASLTEDDFDDSDEEEWAAKHTYHLSWAVFKHLKCKYGTVHIDAHVPF